MKKILITPLLLLLAFCALQAQNTFPSSGNVGIGATTPSQALTLGSGNILLPGASAGNHGNLYFGGRTDVGENGMRLFGGLVNGSIPAGFIDVKTSDAADGLRIRVDASSGGTERMRITATGAVLIGSIGTFSVPSGYKLYVEQGILTEKVKVALKSSSDWADHVFEPGYALKPLSEVAQFVTANKHLPGMPSAATLVSDGGIDMSQMFAKQMEKIEELTLYIIQLDDRIKQLEVENKRLNSVHLKKP